MQINDLFSKLGRGFGLVKAMDYANRAIMQSRDAFTSGFMSMAEEQMREQYILNNLVSYTNDPDWDDVIKLKDAGKQEEAQELAKEIRKRYGLSE